MKRLCILSAPVLLLSALVVGCQDYSEPMVTRLYVEEDCGVAPMAIDCYATLSGGNQTGDPMGGNNNLEVRWNFGDGTGSTSINYHTYNVPGDYTVTVTGTDPDGRTASATHMVTVLADSLNVVAGSSFPDGNVTTADTISFNLEISTCDIDYPAVLGDSVKVEIRWDMGDAADSQYRLTSPRFRYFTAGQYEVTVSVFYPAWAVVRERTLTFNVTDAP